MSLEVTLFVMALGQLMEIMGAPEPPTPAPLETNRSIVLCNKMWGFLWWFTRLVSKKKGTKKEDSVMDRGQQVCDLQRKSPGSVKAAGGTLRAGLGFDAVV